MRALPLSMGEVPLEGSGESSVLGNSLGLPMPFFQNLYNLTKKSLQFQGFTGIIYVTGMQAKNRTSGNNQPEEGKVTL